MLLLLLLPCRDILEGTYFPAVSMYTAHAQTEGATLTANFGAACALLSGSRAGG